MDYLARRDHSEKELREKLSRTFAADVVDSAIADCRDHGWLADPLELAERVAASLHRRAKSFHYIQGFLAKKGLPRVAFDSECERAKAQEIIAKAGKKAGDFKKMYSLLKNRGFDNDTIKKVLYETLGNTSGI